MERYKIPCTTEQTRKARELGAPIGYKNTLDNKERGKFENPTAEEMIGWLEEQGFYFYIYKDDLWNGEVEYGYKWHGSSYDVSSRETATLAVIDAALDHLTKIKK